jgi:carbonic anhydrase
LSPFALKPLTSIQEKNMKRTIAEVLLALALIGSGTFGWMQYKSVGASSGQVTELEDKTAEVEKKLTATEEELTHAKAEVEAAEPLKVKAQELDAVKAAFSGGEILKDLEATYNKQKGLSTERQLGLAAVRLLTLGSKDPSTVEAFRKTLEMTDWKSRAKAICAAQNALAAAGEKITVMSECAGATGGAKEGSGSTEKNAANDHGKGESKDSHAAAGAHAAPHWDYEGPMGPENWGKEFPTCTKGKSQSPLDIKGPFEKVKLSIAPDYKAGQLKILNNGHTIQVNVEPGSKIRIDGMPYDLLQFHFHKPSEELIDGKPAAMVVHFVHKNATGQLAVLGVLLKEGNENPGIKTLWTHAPGKEGPEIAPENVTFNPSNLLPREMDFYSYEGSLTTPPCTEKVRFFILKSQVNIAREQVGAFPFKKNARPVQPLNERVIQSN